MEHCTEFFKARTQLLLRSEGIMFQFGLEKAAIHVTSITFNTQPRTRS